MISSIPLVQFTYKFVLLMAIICNINIGHNISISNDDIFWVNSQLNILNTRTMNAKRWDLENGRDDTNTHVHEYLRYLYSSSLKSQEWEIDYWYNRLMYKSLNENRTHQEKFSETLKLYHELRLIKDDIYDAANVDTVLLENLIHLIIDCKTNTEFTKIQRLSLITEIKSLIPEDFRRSNLFIPSIPYWYSFER